MRCLVRLVSCYLPAWLFRGICDRNVMTRITATTFLCLTPIWFAALYCIELCPPILISRLLCSWPLDSLIVMVIICTSVGLKHREDRQRSRCIGVSSMCIRNTMCSCRSMFCAVGNACHCRRSTHCAIHLGGKTLVWLAGLWFPGCYWPDEERSCFCLVCEHAVARSNGSCVSVRKEKKNAAGLVMEV